jgi:hypothetical protein
VASKLLKLEELGEGEYKTPFGRVVVSRTDGGYKIVVYINEKSLGKSAVKEIVQPLLTSAAAKRRSDLRTPLPHSQPRLHPRLEVLRILRQIALRRPVAYAD